jgi:large subunit ribosomal protein L4
VTSVDIRTRTGETAGSVDLDDAIFGIEPNVPVMHQVVTAQLAAARAGTQSTKTRAEVRGGGAKPWRQKGTGRARQGSTRAPHWEGGGVALGPKPRSYAQRTPKKMIQLALRSALSDRATSERVVVIDSWDFSGPRTKDAVAALTTLGLDGKVLVVVEPFEDLVWKSFRNLSHVHIVLAGELNTYDVLVSDWVVFTRATLPTTADTVGGTTAPVHEPVAAIAGEDAPNTAVPQAGIEDDEQPEPEQPAPAAEESA